MENKDPSRPSKIEVIFYASAAGNEPVREWLKSLEDEDCDAIGQDIKRVQFGWPIGMPLCRNMGKGIWEVRTTLKNKIARCLFCFHEGEIWLLHGFIKKTQQTPNDDIELAIKRKKEIEDGEQT